MPRRLLLGLQVAPKLHPEITGVGIEYGWAVAKQEFRCENDFSVKIVSARVQHALTMLTLPVIRNCARRARDYERAYRALDDGTGTELQHKQIEQMKKHVKHHRNAPDFIAAWATAERQAERARGGGGGPVVVARQGAPQGVVPRCLRPPAPVSPAPPGFRGAGAVLAEAGLVGFLAWGAVEGRPPQARSA